MNVFEEWKFRWPHFSPNEILSPDQLNLFRDRGIVPYSFRALDKLEHFRILLGEPILVNQPGLMHRGARSIKEVHDLNMTVRKNAEEWSYSFHLWCAFDISVKSLTPELLMQAAIESKLWKGIGLYKTWVHVDDRDTFSETPVLWDYTKSI